MLDLYRQAHHRLILLLHPSLIVVYQTVAYRTVAYRTVACQTVECQIAVYKTAVCWIAAYQIVADFAADTTPVAETAAAEEEAATGIEAGVAEAYFTTTIGTIATGSLAVVLRKVGGAPEGSHG